MHNTAPDAGTSTLTISREPHEIRITDHGKIRFFVSFALKFLEENPQRPLIFHTFPSVKPLKPPADAQPPAPSDPSIEADHVEQPLKKRRNASTAAIPRLVTVVEIVKREYGKWAATRQTKEGKPVEDSMRMGLHQYNELGSLEDMGIVPLQEQEPDEAEQLRLALEGKNFLKQKFTAHLKVTLSVHAQPELEESGATHQPPLPIKKSKSAKARERKRRKRGSVQ